MSKRIAENQLTPEELARQLHQEANDISNSNHETADQ